MYKCKSVKSIIVLMIMLLIWVMPLNVYADPSTEEGTTEETTEEESEETTEEESEEEDKNARWEEINGIYYYMINGQKQVGWVKSKGKWYYLDGFGRMQRKTKIGTIELNSAGDAIGISPKDKIVPEPHGYIYYSKDNVVLKNGHEDAEYVEECIDILYKDNRKIDDKDIKAVRALYDNLPLSEKVRVGNETYLAQLELEYRVGYDYETLYASSTDAYVDYGSDYEGKSFGFTINSNNTSICIKIKLPVNGKGEVRVPNITLISPQEEQKYDISNESDQKFSNDYIDADVIWTSEYVQIDILNAKEGDWKITTDDICRFTSGDYNGVKDVFTPVNSYGVNSATDSDDYSPNTNQGNTSSMVGSLILIVLVIGAFVGFMIWIKHAPMGKDKSNENKDEKKENKSQLSKEEEYELLKQELAEFSDEYKDDNVEVNNNVSEVEEKQVKMEFSQEEIKESLESYQPSFSAPDPEAETDVLVSMDGNELRASQYMNNNIQNSVPMNEKEDKAEWFENEE